MEKTVSAADANRKFSELLRMVREGHSYLVTSHGKPIARIVPIGRNSLVEPSARRTLIRRLQSEPVAKIGRWRREELYED